MIVLLNLIQRQLQQYGEMVKCLQQNQVVIFHRLDSIDHHRHSPHVISVLNPTIDAKGDDRISITSAGTSSSGIDDLKLKGAKPLNRF